MTLSNVYFSDIFRNDFWDHFDTFGEKFYFDTFKNDTFESVWVDAHSHSLLCYKILGLTQKGFSPKKYVHTFQYYDVMWGTDVGVANDQQFYYFSDCQIYPEFFLGSLYNSWYQSRSIHNG